jgi:hypothetical protein
VVVNLPHDAAALLHLAYKASKSVKGFSSIKRDFTALASLRRQRLPGSKVANFGEQPRSPAQ